MNKSQMPRCEVRSCDRAAFYIDTVPGNAQYLPNFMVCRRHAESTDRPMVGMPGRTLHLDYPETP